MAPGSSANAAEPDYEALAREVVRSMLRLRRPHPVPGGGDADGASHAAPPGFPHPPARPPFPSDLRDASRGAPIVLALLAHEESPTTPRRLCELSGLSKGRISNIVSALEAKGYVRKDPSPKDARSVVVSLTAKGHEFTDAHKDAMIDHTAAVLRQLGPRDARDAVRILSHLAEIMAQAPLASCAADNSQDRDGQEAR